MSNRSPWKSAIIGMLTVIAGTTWMLGALAVLEGAFEIVAAIPFTRVERHRSLASIASTS